MDEEKPADANGTYRNLGTRKVVIDGPAHLNGGTSKIDVDGPVHLNQGSYKIDVDGPVHLDQETNVTVETSDDSYPYDIVDTPMITNPVKGYQGMSQEEKTEEKKSITDCSVPSGDLDCTDNHIFNENFDATDAPGSTVAAEHEDGRFGRYINQKTKETDVPVPSGSFTDSSHSIHNDISDSYPMNTTPRGYFLIINNRDFLPYSEMYGYPRKGTDIDANAMISLFQELGYDISQHKNLTASQMMQECKRAARVDFRKYSAFVCCVLSHGKEGVLYGTDTTIEIKEMTSYFKGDNLAGKPKVFFFQACQGSDYMDGVNPRGIATDSVDGPSEYGNDISLPTEADFMYAYSTVPGYYSWRNSARGSWFIQTLVEVFRQYAHKMDVIRMLTRVNQQVSTKKSATGVRQSHEKRQISSIITQLRYELYLTPPGGPLKKYNPQ